MAAATTQTRRHYVEHHTDDGDGLAWKVFTPDGEIHDECDSEAEALESAAEVNDSDELNALQEMLVEALWEADLPTLRRYKAAIELEMTFPGDEIPW